jgi:hypothetical protein
MGNSCLAVALLFVYKSLHITLTSLSLSSRTIADRHLSPSLSSLNASAIPTLSTLLVHSTAPIESFQAYLSSSHTKPSRHRNSASIVKMADLARDELIGTFKSLLSSGKYSDFVITCGNDTHNVHKAVVCSRSGFLERAERFPVGTVS